MNSRLSLRLSVLAFATLLPLCAVAQLNQTGTLSGEASDPQGLPLPGVTVVLRSPALIAPQLATQTGGKGQYRYLSLPPGLYEVAFTLDGMEPYVRKGLRIGVGQTTTVDAVLRLKGVSQDLVVVGKAPTIDLEANTSTTSLDQKFLAAIPTARNLDAVFNLAPGVVAESNNPSGAASSMNGSSVRDNTFNLDGVNITAPDVGTQMVEFGMDIIEEVSIQAGGLPAEYGDASGAVVNVVTRSGGNEMKGSVSLFYTNDSLQSTNTNGTPLEGSKSGYRYVVEPGVTLGGALAKDRLWFFTNLSFNQRSTNVPGYPYGQADQKSVSEFRPYPFVKLSFQPSEKDRFTASYAFSDFRQSDAGASAFNTESSTIKWSQPTDILNAQWSRTFSSSVFGDFKVGYVKNRVNSEAKNSDPSFVDLMTNVTSGGRGVNDLYSSTRFQSNLNGSLFLDGASGFHELKGGAELQLTASTRDFQPNPDPRNGMGQIMTAGGAPVYGIAFAPVSSKLATTNVAGYVQDTWRPSRRLTINGGLRLTHQEGRIPAQNETEGPQTFLGVTYNRSVPESLTPIRLTSLDPRLGGIFDITGDSKTLLKASYSRYTHSNVTEFFSSTNPNGFFVYAQALMPNGMPVPGAYLMAIYPNAAKVGWGGTDLKAPRTDEVVVSVEREITAEWSAAARYARKWDRDLVHAVDASQLDMNSLMSGNGLVWTNWVQVPFTDPYDGVKKYFWSQKAILPQNLYLVNPPGAKRDFDGFELTVVKKYSHGWSLMASYVWQDLRGLIGTDWNASYPGTSLYQNPNAHIDAEGTLNMERKNQFKLHGMVTGPWGVNASGSFRWLAGQHYTRTVASTDMGVSLAQGQTIINAEANGSRELPAQAVLDLRLEKVVPVAGLSVAVFVDVFNLFNEGAATEVQTRSGNPTLVFGQMTRIENPRIFRLGFRAEF